MERTIEQYVAISAEIQNSSTQFFALQAQREEEARKERALEANDLKVLYTRQLEEMQRARESAERKQERKEDEFLNPKEPLCKIYATSAEEFISETDKFEEQLFDNQVYKPRRMYILLKRAIHGSARAHVELWLTRQPGYGLWQKAQKTDDPRTWLDLYQETMYILAKFAGWQIDHPMQLAMML